MAEKRSPAPARSDKERLAAIETEMGHLKESIEEVYRYLRNEFSNMVSKQTEDLRSRQKEYESALTKKAACADVDGIDKRQEKLEGRIRALERFMWKAIGALAVLAFLAPFLMSKMKLF